MTICGGMLAETACLSPSAPRALCAIIGEQITHRQGGALAGIGVVACGHLNCRVSKLGAAGKDAVLFNDGIAEKFSEFVNFLPGRDPFAFQPLDQALPMSLAAITSIRGRLPFPR